MVGLGGITLMVHVDDLSMLPLGMHVHGHVVSAFLSTVAFHTNSQR